MAQAYLGEIRMFGFGYTTPGWLPCDGRLLLISEYDALYFLIGSRYGGDEQNTFALPDLRSRVPIHQGTGAGLTARVMGDTGGTESITITPFNMPAHTHRLAASTDPASSNSPVGHGFPAATQGTLLYSNGSGMTAQMSASAITSAGQSLPLDNMMPFLTINFHICVYGIFPPQN